MKVFVILRFPNQQKYVWRGMLAAVEVVEVLLVAAPNEVRFKNLEDVSASTSGLTQNFRMATATA